MTDWFELALPLLVTLLWLWGPGLATTASVRLRGPLAWAVAPAVSVGIIAVSAMLGPVLGLAWGPLPPFLMTAAIAATAWCVRALVSRLGSSRSGRHCRPAVEVPAQPSGHSGRRERILEVLGSHNGITVLAVLLGAAVMTEIDMTDWICPGGTCVPEIGNVYTYLDDKQISATYSTTMGPALAQEIERSGFRPR